MQQGGADFGSRFQIRSRLQTTSHVRNLGDLEEICCVSQSAQSTCACTGAAVYLVFSDFEDDLGQFLAHVVSIALAF